MDNGVSARMASETAYMGERRWVEELQYGSGRGEASRGP
jgi:hypothetical protein